MCLFALVLDNRFKNTFFSSFRLIGITLKTYPAMDCPVYGEADGANFILVED